MTKRALVLLAAALLGACALVAAGCAQEVTHSPYDHGDPMPTTSLPLTTVPGMGPLHAWGFTVNLEDIEVRVKEPVDDTATLDEVEGASLPEGEKVVYVMVTIKNTGSESYDYSVLSFTMLDTEYGTYDASGVSTKPTLGAGELAAGEIVKGAAAFRMPLSAVPSAVTFARDPFGKPLACWVY